MKQGDFLIYTVGNKIEIGKWVRTTLNGKLVIVPKAASGRHIKLRKRDKVVSLNDLFQKYRGLL